MNTLNNQAIIANHNFWKPTIINNKKISNFFLLPGFLGKRVLCRWRALNLSNLTEGRSLSRNYHVWKMTMDRTKVIDDKPCLGSCQQDPRLTFLRGKLFLCFSSPDLGWPQRQLWVGLGSGPEREALCSSESARPWRLGWCSVTRALALWICAKEFPQRK